MEALRKVYWVKPELVAEIEYAEWTEGASSGSGPKLRAPVFLGLRDDKDPKECKLDQERPTENQQLKANCAYLISFIASMVP